MPYHARNGVNVATQTTCQALATGRRSHPRRRHRCRRPDHRGSTRQASRPSEAHTSNHIYRWFVRFVWFGGQACLLSKPQRISRHSRLWQVHSIGSSAVIPILFTGSCGWGTTTKHLTNQLQVCDVLNSTRCVYKILTDPFGRWQYQCGTPPFRPPIPLGGTSPATIHSGCERFNQVIRWPLRHPQKNDIHTHYWAGKLRAAIGSVLDPRGGGLP